jgi:hypothetical protein
LTYKKVNLTLQLISKWFQINQDVLNENKTFAINFSLAKTRTHTLNLIQDIQNLNLTESIKFWDMHLEQFIMETVRGKIIEETEYSML